MGLSTRRRMEFEPVYPELRVQRAPDVEAFSTRPAKFIPHQAIQLRVSTEGIQPTMRLLTAAMPKRHGNAKASWANVGRRFFALSSSIPFEFGHPPVGNLGRNFKGTPPRQLSALLPTGLLNYEIPQYPTEE
jgi:hypothetical protein